jgi:adenylosuccinate lyase
VILAEGFLATDEMLRRALRLVRGLALDPTSMQRNLATHGTFAATERLLMELVRAGADRQEMHEVLRAHSMAAWETIRRGEPNPLADLLAADFRLTAHLPAERIRSLLDVSGYVGDAPQRARALAQRIRNDLTQRHEDTKKR